MNIETQYKSLITEIEDAGEAARDYFYAHESQNVAKSDGSLVTEIDTMTEDRLRAHIVTYFPDDTIVGEEGDDTVGTSGFVWYIDPIDGTENFIRKIPFFCITEVRLGPSAEGSFAVVHNPITKQTFASIMEDGVYENTNLCELSAQGIANKTLIHVTSNKDEEWMKPARYRLQAEFARRYGKSGIFGSALLEYAYVASNRIDGFLNIGLNAWDSAAGLYLVKAAGGAISIYADGKWSRYEGPIKELYGQSRREKIISFVSHPAIHDEILELVGDPRQWAEN